MAEAPVPEAVEHPLGVARGQVANTYIVAEASDGLVIVDQHAAHERIVLERLKAAGAGDKVAAAQALLIPEVVEMEEVDCDRVEEAIPVLGEIGLTLERFGPTAMLVRSVPAAWARAMCRRWCAMWPMIWPPMASRCCWASGSIWCWPPWPAMAACGRGGR
jgi:DNA mismatch repair protein MutL